MKNAIFMMFFGFLGGIAGAILFTSTPLRAALDLEDVSFLTIQSYNNAESRVAYLGPHSHAEGALFLFDEVGRPLVQLGSYNQGEEKGQAILGLHDRNNRLRFIFRLYGDEDSPTIIMKDSSERDRLIIGLNPETQLPYFKYMDVAGNMKNMLEQ